jgi:ligand-binding SRPBCC domain-containing protein
MRRHVVVVSTLAAPRAAVWAAVATMRGVNDELRPWLRMTHPRGLERLDAQPVPLGVRLFRSWILMGGVLPVDYDDLVLTRLEPGRGFREESTMLTMRRWVHERTLADAPGGCELCDHLEFEPRAAVPGAAAAAVVRALFAHRHARLRARFGG